MRIVISCLLLVLVGVAVAEVTSNEARDLLLDLLKDALASKRATSNLVSYGGSGIHYCGAVLDRMVAAACRNYKREEVEGAFMSPEVAKRFLGLEKRDLNEECCNEVCSNEEVVETC